MSFEFVPISENLRREELILQIADRLKLIQTFSETLFDRVDSKLSLIGQKLENIDSRSSVCLRKIAYLKEDDRKATTLYSHHKFPSAEIGVTDSYPSLFNDDSYDLDVELRRRLGLKKGPDGEMIGLPKHSIVATHIPYDDDAKLKSQFFIYDKVHNVSVYVHIVDDDYNC